MSRWTTPRSCAYCSASQICGTISAPPPDGCAQPPSPRGRSDRRRTRARDRRVPRLADSWTATMFGCARRAIAFASRWNRRQIRAPAPSPGGSTFSARSDRAPLPRLEHDSPCRRGPARPGSRTPAASPRYVPRRSDAASPRHRRGERAARTAAPARPADYPARTLALGTSPMEALSRLRHPISYRSAGEEVQGRESERLPGESARRDTSRSCRSLPTAAVVAPGR